GRINDYQMTIASAVEEQTATTNEMSRSVTEAATGSTEIAGNITGIATAAQDNSSTMTQVSSAVSELASISEGLRAQVAQFRLCPTSHSGGPADGGPARDVRTTHKLASPPDELG